ncbi:hypothetical protein FIU97_03590 [Roseivivax sp. THAF40]|uniref:hypothetical protein n=1 Tax=unclassified Roseivivax TaxID=2639302 RepID=UPI0012687CCE|nr:MULTISPECIES: hypothetical protein [unclassified Roseivivax]QFS81851.1 hypothetical protein FIV09_03330 [Roseivivax sp. THAF197b]QFT45651.1 hypothetical protein FIU97_03590 [Roseivivax sp. THAF40]
MTATLLVVIGAVAVAQAYITISFAAAYIEARFLRIALPGRQIDPEKIVTVAVQATALISLIVTAALAALLWTFIE